MLWAQGVAVGVRLGCGGQGVGLRVERMRRFHDARPLWSCALVSVRACVRACVRVSLWCCAFVRTFVWSRARARVCCSLLCFRTHLSRPEMAIQCGKMCNLSRVRRQDWHSWRPLPRERDSLTPNPAALHNPYLRRRARARRGWREGRQQRSRRRRWRGYGGPRAWGVPQHT